MTVRWSEIARGNVEEVLRRCGVQSHECDAAAREILPLAREVDAGARTMSIRPRGRAPFVVPRADLRGRRWYTHYTVDVTAHCVDALTGADGTETEHYLAKHWQFAEQLVLAPEELPDVG